MTRPQHLGSAPPANDRSIDSFALRSYILTMRTAKRPPDQTGITILKQMQKHEWSFEFPRITDEVDEQLEIAIDWMRYDVRIAKRMFRELIGKYPEHVDAYHHLALTWYRQGNMAKAAEVWKHGTEFALKLFPANFSMKRDRLMWGFLENRPFLRLYQGYGLSLMKMGQSEKALEVFENMLAMNPNDNQGVRGLVVECNFGLNRPEAVLALCDRYRTDGMEQLAYGRPLALFQLGRIQEAAKALRRARKFLPLIAEELVKTTHKRPDGWNEERITLGGKDQAYDYWKEHGKYWQDTPGAIAFLRKHPGKTGIG
jgi:tetratricopeptide (TPR) repeat protein